MASHSTIEQSIHPISSTRMMWQLSIFLFGFLALLTLHLIFTHLTNQLSAQVDNERARLFIGERVVEDIQKLESNVYKMASTLGVAGQQHVRKDALVLIEELTYYLNVLKNGGTVRQVISLNLGGRDRMINEVSYDPSVNTQQVYVLEAIDLLPKMQQIQSKIDQLAALLKQKHTLHQHAEHSTYLHKHIELEREIDIFLKKLQPLFVRLTENANRMFYTSYKQLTRIEQNIEQQSYRYRLVETIFVVVIIFSVMILGFIFTRQITRANNQLVEAKNRAQRAKDEAVRANKAKSEFLSSMSHELRTPMNAILGFAQLLELEEDMTDDQQDSVQEIIKGGNHLLRLINEVLDLAKIESGHLDLKIELVSVDQAIQDCLSLVATLSSRYSVTLKHEPGEMLIVSADFMRLKQVILNLLSNAIKYNHVGGEVCLKAQLLNSSTVRIEVIDNGPGISVDKQKELFQAFNRLGAENGAIEGTGIGLALTRDIVEAMGGQVTVSSELGVGSTFGIELPLA